MPHSLIISPQIHRMYKYMTVRVKCIEKKIYVHVFHILHQQIYTYFLSRAGISRIFLKFGGNSCILTYSNTIT